MCQSHGCIIVNFNRNLRKSTDVNQFFYARNFWRTWGKKKGLSGELLGLIFTTDFFVTDFTTGVHINLISFSQGKPANICVAKFLSNNACVIRKNLRQ